MEKCARCHRNQDPIFRVAPWSNTLTIPANFVAFVHRLKKVFGKKWEPLFSEVEKLRKNPDAGQMIKSAGLTGIPKFTDEIAKSETVAKANFRGVRLLPESLAEEAGGASAPGEFQAAVVIASDELLFRQIFSSTMPLPDRQMVVETLVGKHLGETLRQGLLGTFGVGNEASIKTEEARRHVVASKTAEALGLSSKLPAIHGPLLVDRNHVTGKESKIRTFSCSRGWRLPPQKPNCNASKTMTPKEERPLTKDEIRFRNRRRPNVMKIMSDRLVFSTTTLPRPDSWD